MRELGVPVDLDFLRRKVEVGGAGGSALGARGDHGFGLDVGAPLSLEATEAYTSTIQVGRGNGELLEAFLASRRIGRSTEVLYTCAVKTFEGLGGVPLDGAGAGVVDDWFRLVNTRGLGAGTVITYAGKLRKLLEYAYRGRGMGRRAAALRAAIAFDGVPWDDLRREVMRLSLDADMLLTGAELGALIRTADHPRAKALLTVGYESGCRKGELLGARVRDLREGSEYAELTVMGKTGLRVLPLVRSMPALRAWLDVHPDPSSRAPLLPSVVDGEIRQMDGGSPNALFTYLCRRAGLRHLHPHQLRHTRLTELAAAGLGEYQLKSFAGWTPDSRMAARYIHLSGRAHMRDVLRTEGVDVRDLSHMGPAGVAELPGMLAAVLGRGPVEAEG